MIVDVTSMLISTLSSQADMICGLFTKINMTEHQNEVICFAGIESYKTAEQYHHPAGTARGVSVTYTVNVLGKRYDSAEQLVQLIDNGMIPAVENAFSAITGIKRCPCEYLKEHDRYYTEFKIDMLSEAIETVAVQGIDLKINGTAITGFTNYKYERGNMTEQTVLADGTIASRKVGTSPAKITVWSDTSTAALGMMYGQMMPFFYAPSVSVSVGGSLSSSSMVLSNLELTGTAQKSTRITAEFTEVNSV